MFSQYISRYMFCQHIRRVLRTQDFCECEVLLLESVLNPEIGHMKMSDFTQTSSSTYSDSGSRISEYLKLKVYPKIGSQRLQSEPMGGSSTYASKLSFSA